MHDLVDDSFVRPNFVVSSPYFAVFLFPTVCKLTKDYLMKMEEGFRKKLIEQNG